jgi:hypothetical protein
MRVSAQLWLRSPLVHRVNEHIVVHSPAFPSIPKDAPISMEPEQSQVSW